MPGAPLNSGTIVGRTYLFSFLFSASDTQILFCEMSEMENIFEKIF